MAKVVSVARSQTHSFSKQRVPSITLLAGLGVEGDCHAGVTVKHRSRVARDPTQPNLRQVHLIHEELFDELSQLGHTVQPGELGENIATRGIDLLGLPQKAQLHIGASVVLEITGLRNPCQQIEDFQSGLLRQVLKTLDGGRVVRKAGVMAIVVTGGVIVPEDKITIELPHSAHIPLEKV